MKQAGWQALERALVPGPGQELALAKGLEMRLKCLWKKTVEEACKQVQVQALLRSKTARQEPEPQVLGLGLAQQAQERELGKLGRRMLTLLLLKSEVRVPGRTGQLERESESVDGNSRALKTIAGSPPAIRQWPLWAAPRQWWWSPRS